MSKLKDLTGQQFGYLTVLYRVPGRERTTWHCVCKCGNETDALSTSLLSGSTTACNRCHGYKIEKMKGRVSPKLQDLTGQRFGQLTVLEYDRKSRKWLCQCDCGRTVKMVCTYLTNGSRTDCGHTAFQATGERVKSGSAGSVNGTNIFAIQHIMDGKLRTTNTSGVTGVSVCQRRGKPAYKARIGIHNKEISLGTFSTFEEAVAARKAAEDKYFKPVLDETLAKCRTKNKP